MRFYSGRSLAQTPARWKGEEGLEGTEIVRKDVSKLMIGFDLYKAHGPD